MKKKILIHLMFIILVCLCVFMSGCSYIESVNNNTKAETNVKTEDENADNETLSTETVRQTADVNGNIIKYKDLPYYDYTDVMCLNNSEGRRARKYYKENSRQIGDFIVTDYDGGICINKYVGKYIEEGVKGDAIIEIPEKIDGKMVIKIGCYPCERGWSAEDGNEKAIGAFSEISSDVTNRKLNIILPKTLREIPIQVIRPFYVFPEPGSDWCRTYGIINNFKVDKSNPYYTSDKGSLYDKNKKWLLYKTYETESFDIEFFKVPDSVEYVADFIVDNLGGIEFGKNIKQIDAWFMAEDPSGYTVMGYLNTPAEEWADSCGCSFIGTD
ncbi:MAG: hypothetical protein J1E41_06070 [Ruminococcus sp.]|nr:hypothetical protein [Ruminococcus sp.]